MQRADFLRTLLALLAGSGVLPGWLKGALIHYRKYYLLECFVRGFRFYDGPSLLGEMKTGDELELVRERDNEFDACAIALHWNGRKMGFLPAEENKLLSRLLDIGAPELSAEITHLQPDAATWENVRVVVYVLKEIADKDAPDPAGYLTTLSTPQFQSLKTADDRISRLKRSISAEYLSDPDDDFPAGVNLEGGPESAALFRARDQLYRHTADTSAYFLLKREVFEETTYGKGRLAPVSRTENVETYVKLTLEEALDFSGMVKRLDFRVMDGKEFVELIIS